MNRKSPSRPKKRQTTLTLPAESLTEAQRIAHARKVNLSSVITEALNAGLRLQTAGEQRALLQEPPTPPRRSHQLMESRQERLVRWRFDGMIAATALVTRPALAHNNASDFEAIRGAIEQAPERFPNLGPLELIRCTSLA